VPKIWIFRSDSLPVEKLSNKIEVIMGEEDK